MESESKAKQFIRKNPNLSSLILSALIAVALFFILLFSLFQLLVHFYPSESILEDGTVMKNQAFAQFFMSLVVSGTISFILFIVLFFKTGRKFEGWAKQNKS